MRWDILPADKLFAPLYPGSCRRACEGVSRRDKERRQVRGTWGLYSFSGGSREASPPGRLRCDRFTTTTKMSASIQACICAYNVHVDMRSRVCTIWPLHMYAHTQAYTHMQLGDNELTSCRKPAYHSVLGYRAVRNHTLRNRKIAFVVRSALGALTCTCTEPLASEQIHMFRSVTASRTQIYVTAHVYSPFSQGGSSLSGGGLPRYGVTLRSGGPSREGLGPGRAAMERWPKHDAWRNVDDMPIHIFAEDGCVLVHPQPGHG